MQILPDFRAVPKPATVTAYLDKVQFWLREPLTTEMLETLRKQCGRGGLYAESRAARFDAQMRQRIELRQPSYDVLRSLAKETDDAFINRAEFALDFAFETPSRRDDGFEYLHHHLVRRYHGKRQEIRCYRGRAGRPIRQESIETTETRYDAGRWAPNLLIAYKEKHSRITGEINCVHLEWRCNGRSAIRRAGIDSATDLVQLDYRQFWSERFLLLAAPCGRIGRLFRNRSNGGKSRCDTRLDRRLGHVFVSGYDTVQDMIDHCGKSLRLRRALTEMPNEAWLPSNGDSL